jgi:hypothetical protein
MFYLSCSVFLELQVLSDTCQFSGMFHHLIIVVFCFFLFFFFKYFTYLSQNISLGITKISNILDKHEGSLSTQ